MPIPEDQNNDQRNQRETEVASFDNYEQEIMSSVPFGGLDMMTESAQEIENGFLKED